MATSGLAPDDDRVLGADQPLAGVYRLAWMPSSCRQTSITCPDAAPAIRNWLMPLALATCSAAPQEPPAGLTLAMIRGVDPDASIHAAAAPPAAVAAITGSWKSSNPDAFSARTWSSDHEPSAALVRTRTACRGPSPPSPAQMTLVVPLASTVTSYPSIASFPLTRVFSHPPLAPELSPA